MCVCVCVCVCIGALLEVGSGAGKGYNVNIPWPHEGVGDTEYLAAFHSIIMPIALAFNPQVVLVSAGFDAARGDPLGGCQVSPYMSLIIYMYICMFIYMLYIYIYILHIYILQVE